MLVYNSLICFCLQSYFGIYMFSLNSVLSHSTPPFFLAPILSNKISDDLSLLGSVLPKLCIQFLLNVMFQKWKFEKSSYGHDYYIEAMIQFFSQAWTAWPVDSLNCLGRNFLLKTSCTGKRMWLREPSEFCLVQLVEWTFKLFARTPFTFFRFS